MKKLMFTFASLLACMGVFTPIYAADLCENAQTQMALTQCEQKNYKVSDNKLNDMYRQVRSSFSLQQQALLRGSQRAWLHFRDSECELRTVKFKDGSVYPMVYSRCLIELTEKRTADLKEMMNCAEGDVSCSRQSGLNRDSI